MRLVLALSFLILGCNTDKMYLDTAYIGDVGSEDTDPMDARTDDDRDGSPADEDCDDNDPSIHPEAEEVCDGVDNNCDGEVDEGLLTQAYSDADADGYGDPETAEWVCELMPGQVVNGLDCDDGDPEIHPDATDICDGVDNDCDLQVDEDADGLIWYLDQDGDGYGDSDTVVVTCGETPPESYVAVGGDCDDALDTVYPGAPERCDEIDNDCNGLIDDGMITVWYADFDGDGTGNPGMAMEACDPGAGYVDNDLDCDDTDASVSPWAFEACNGYDDDCDGVVDEPDALDATTWYQDVDGDGFGDDGVSITACEAPSGYIEVSGDCDDAVAAVNPDALEVCNGIDDDCDGAVDADDPDVTDALTYAIDSDGDGYGSPATSLRACDAPSGYVSDDSDCDDTDTAVHPGAEEHCNGIDDDCDGAVDADDGDVTDAEIYWLDVDGDGFGSELTSVEACDPPTGFVLDDTDCDDLDAAVNPDADEICNGIDDDCDGLTDATDPSVTDADTYYIDHDGDGYGSDAYTEVACDPPTGFVLDDTDCDDLSADVNPDAEEDCNGEDDDCDGAIGWQETDVDGDGFLACQEALWLETSRSYHNDPAASGAYGSLEAAVMLSDHGVRSTSSVMYSVAMTEELLDVYGMLVIYGQGYDGPFSSDEAAALEAWVYDGGRLFYVGGWGSGSSCATTNSLPIEFGIACGASGWTWSGTSSLEGTHPVEDGIATISGLGGEIWTVSAPASTLGATGGWPTLVVAEYGEGRVVGLSDEWPLYNTGTNGYYDISAHDNRQMIDNIWAWLSEVGL